MPATQIHICLTVMPGTVTVSHQLSQGYTSLQGQMDSNTTQLACQPTYKAQAIVDTLTQFQSLG